MEDIIANVTAQIEELEQKSNNVSNPQAVRAYIDAIRVLKTLKKDLEEL